jgi:hypothetical protein
MAAGRLVIEREYEPPPAEELGAMLTAVYERIFDAALLERLTGSLSQSTIQPSETDEKGARGESCTVSPSVN